jgi:hypothetical protein
MILMIALAELTKVIRPVKSLRAGPEPMKGSGVNE